MTKRLPRIKEIEDSSAAELIASAKHKSELLTDRILELERLYANNEYLIHDHSRRECLSGTFAGNAYAALQIASFSYELVRLSALWDAAARDRVSLPELYALTRRADVRKLLQAENSRYYRERGLFMFVEESDRRFPRNCRILDHLVPAALASTRLKRLIAHRNAYYAHNLIQPLREAPAWKSESKMRRLSKVVVNAIAGITRDAWFDYEDSERICRKDARELWIGVKWTEPT